MISSARYWFLITLVIIVYIAGMFVTLFENDSAQFAVMAMRMVQENDFFTLIKGTEEYLDKPHMHYWLAALSFKFFGIHDWAYRIPAILATLLGAYSCYGLGRLLYNNDIGRFSALIFMTAQTIVLSNIDVRTDAVLTGFTIFSIWQLVRYVETGKLVAILLGAFGAGMAFCTKGQIALVVIGISVLCHLAYTRKWKSLLNWKVFLALLVFAITIAPMLYAYYLQFDLHPEKVIRGKANRSGIFFIFWEQSFERLSGQGVGKNSSDYFFFFHTFLWVFLPWTVLALIAYWRRVKTFIKLRFQYKPQYEFLTLGGITILFFVISFAQFKLPHYMNILIPLYSILAASYLHSLYRYSKHTIIKVLLGIQYFVLSVVFIFVLLVCFHVFKFEKIHSYFILISLLAVITYFCLKREAYYMRIITLSVYSSLLLNGVMNTHFYPSLLKYQAGSTMAQIIHEENIPVDEIYKVSKNFSWALDFYNKKPVSILGPEELYEKHNIWIYANDDELERLANLGYHWHDQHTVDQFRITRLQARFLNPHTRQKILNKMHLVRLD
ncbi:ArnT family glycosyltransferase [Flagellimonas allohymeniacidonis]|uniref:Glycosyltransferase family 39 protein n=1 Tax=Flagellimonas allohymeniacidonis TaxID=2517819 RepID=A0A4Q8QFT6_9FLAO|nr:glycosyltransferase family 39 protein [Allomuricauda hymeniacidonis]TAI49375.1 glycosyltransferase family 39 protein [Allomuricauda hymeniacidonis]